MIKSTQQTSTKAPQVLKPTRQTPIILVHGFRGSPIGLQEIAQILRDGGFEVYIPAIPPFGDSPKLPEYTAESYADFLAQYIKDSNLHRPILVGHSMGSLVVASALQKYPKLFHRKAILMSPISKRTAVPFRVVAPLSGLAPRRVVDYITTKFLFIPKNNKPLFRKTLTITHKCSNDHPPLRSEVLQSAKFSTHYAITDFNMQQEILLLGGANDRLINQKQTLKAANKIGARTHFLSNTGHLHNYEQPTETAQVIMDFLQEAE